MGILDNFERGLERAVNGAFAKTFRSGLQPVEISSALKREVDTTAAVVSRDRILAAHRFRVGLASADYDRMTRLGPALIEELATIITRYGAAQGYTFPGPVSVVLEEDPALSLGIMDIRTTEPDEAAEWIPVLQIAGRTYPLSQARTVIGRGSDADITVADPGTSRRHVEVLWDGREAQVRDLGSTNGSRLDGERIGQARLAPESVIQIGRTDITYRLVAQSAGNGASAPRGDAPRAPRADGFWGTE